MGKTLLQRRFFAFLFVVSFSALFGFFLLPRFFAHRERKLISPLVLTQKAAEEERPRAEGGVAKFWPFSKILGLSDTSVPEEGSARSPSLSKTSLVRDYLNRAVDNLGQVLGVENQGVSPETAVSGSSPTPTLTPTPTAAPVITSPASSTPTAAAALVPTSSPTPTLSSATSTPTPLATEQKAVKTTADNVGQTLVEKDFLSLYGLMGEDFKSTYSEKDFLESTGQGQSITETTLFTTPEIFGSADDWGKVSMRAHFANGTSRDYMLILHKEGGEWKLFGTEEVS